MEYVETLLCTKGRIELFELHLQRIAWGLYQNGYQIPPFFADNARNVILNALPQDNHYYRIRYLPEIEKTGKYTDRIEIFPIAQPSLQILSLGIYTEQKKYKTAPWNAKTTQRTLYQAATQWATKQSLDDAIILNEHGNIIETTIFNIFILKNGVLYTPPLSDMPVKGVFRTWMMYHSVFPIIEKSLTTDDLLNAESILLTNAVRGIQSGKIIPFAHSI